MRVWYADIFIHRLKELGALKLGEHGKLVKFLGYPEGCNGYRTYDPITHKVEVVWAPIFQEEAKAVAHMFFKLAESDSDSDVEVSPENRSTPATTVDSPPSHDGPIDMARDASHVLPVPTPTHHDRPARVHHPPHHFDPSKYGPHSR